MNKLLLQGAPGEFFSKSEGTKVELPTYGSDMFSFLKACMHGELYGGFLELGYHFQGSI